MPVSSPVLSMEGPCLTVRGLPCPALSWPEVNVLQGLASGCPLLARPQSATVQSSTNPVDSGAGVKRQISPEELLRPAPPLAETFPKK